MAAVCNPTLGVCQQSIVKDGTPCNGDGTCSNGTCSSCEQSMVLFALAEHTPLGIYASYNTWPPVAPPGLLAWQTTTQCFS
jgi:hypothetical protein